MRIDRWLTNASFWYLRFSRVEPGQKVSTASRAAEPVYKVGRFLIQDCLRGQCALVRLVRNDCGVVQHSLVDSPNGRKSWKLILSVIL